MARAPVALPMFGGGRWPTGFGFALIIAAAAAAGWTAARADPGIDCKAVNRGALNVELATTASDVRSITLRSGETLTFIFHAEPGPFGMLTLLEGAGSPRLLLVGPTGTSVSFAAAGAGSFRFQFAKDGDDAASFTASCTSGRSAGRGATRPPVLRRDTGRVDNRGLASDFQQMAGPEGPSVAAGLPLPLHADSVPPAADGAIAPPKQAGGPEMKLHWHSERYAAAGPEGPQVDGNASGVEIGINYKLQSAIRVGALAHFDPASETPFGGQPSLSDHAWLAGPVTTVHFAPGLVLDMRAAWGSAESGADDVTGTGPAAQRRLLSARLANPHAFGAWRFTPSINFSHFEETLHGASSAEDQSAAEASRVAGSGRIDIAPELAYRIDMASATFIEPKAVLGSFWAFDGLSALAPGAGVHLEPRLKAEAGVTLGIINGPKLQALGVVEEGDGTAPDAWSGRLQFSVPLK